MCRCSMHVFIHTRQRKNNPALPIQSRLPRQTVQVAVNTASLGLDDINPVCVDVPNPFRFIGFTIPANAVTPIGGFGSP